MGIPNLQQRLYLANALNEDTDHLFDHPDLIDENEGITEGVTRKHFQQVADVIAAHPDPKERARLAAHHAEIFKKQNPRFDHERFFKAAKASYPSLNEEEIEEEWGGGFQSSSDAQREVQAGLRADYKKDKAEKIRDIKAVLSGKMTKNAFTRKHKTSFTKHPLAKKMMAQRAAKSKNPMNEERTQNQQMWDRISARAGERIKALKAKGAKFVPAGPRKKGKSAKGTWMMPDGKPAYPSSLLNADGTRMNEESISEGVKRMRRLRSARWKKDGANKELDAAYDRELSKLSASRLRRGGASKATVRGFFKDQPATSAENNAYERFTRSAMQKANAKGKKIF